MSAGQYHYCFLTDRESIGMGKFAGQEAEARALRARLAKEPATAINASGDRFTYVGDHVLLSLARTETMPTFDLVGETNFHPMPEYMVRAMTILTQCVRDQMIMADKRR